MRILIDADGCPVVDLTIRIAGEYGVACTILCDTSHQFVREGADTVTVSKGADSVDFALVNMVKPGDLVITQDYGLAAMCLARGAAALRQDGLVYDDTNMEALLLERHNSRKIRMSGGRLKGHAKRSAQEDQAYAAGLRDLLAGRQSGEAEKKDLT